MSTKPCPKCGEEKELENFYFNKKTNSYTARCKKCITNSQKQYYKTGSSDTNSKFKELNEKGQKICKTCLVYKNLEDFLYYNNRYNLHCKVCLNKIQRTRPSRKETAKKYTLNNKKKLKQKHKKWYEENKEKILKKEREDYRSNKELYSSYQKKYYSKNKEKILEKAKIKRKTYKPTEKQKEKRRRYKKNKWKNDRCHRNKSLISRRIREILTNFNLTKKDSTVNYLGCTIRCFVDYLESLFEPGMTWENQGYNGWHIGHIIPAEIFNLNLEKEIYKCFHYSNLRPEWGMLNKQRNDILPDGRRARDIPDDKKIEERTRIYGKDIEI